MWIWVSLRPRIGGHLKGFMTVTFGSLALMTYCFPNPVNLLDWTAWLESNLMNINTILLTDICILPKNIGKLGSLWTFQHWNWSPLGIMLRCSGGRTASFLFLQVFNLVTDNWRWLSGKLEALEPARCWFLDLSIQLTHLFIPPLLQHSKGCKMNFYSSVNLKNPSRFFHLCSVIPTILSFVRRQCFILCVCIKPWFALGCSAAERDRKCSEYRDLLLGDFSLSHFLTIYGAKHLLTELHTEVGFTTGFWLGADLVSSPFATFWSSFCGHYSLHLLVLPQMAELECLF